MTAPTNIKERVVEATRFFLGAMGAMCWRHCQCNLMCARITIHDEAKRNKTGRPLFYP